MRTIWPIAFALALTTTASLADTRAYEDEQLARYTRYAGEPIDEFPFTRLDHWQVVGQYKVVLWTTLLDAYLVTLTPPCTQLEYANGLGVTHNTVQQVSRKFDYVTFERQRCPISEIRRIDYRALRAQEKGADKASKS